MQTTTLAVILLAAAIATPAIAATNAPSQVRFDFDSASLPASAVDTLAEVAAAARANPNARIVLDAHCDPIGTGPYNVRLAIRRAEAVRYGLMADGVDPARIVFAVYGKDGVARATHAEERRVGMTLTTDSMASVIDETFDGHGTAVTWERPLTLAQIRTTATGAIATR